MLKKSTSVYNMGRKIFSCVISFPHLTVHKFSLPWEHNDSKNVAYPPLSTRQTKENNKPQHIYCCRTPDQKRFNFDKPRMEQMTWIQSPDSYFLKDQYCQQSLSVTGHTIIKKFEHWQQELLQTDNKLKRTTVTKDVMIINEISFCSITCMMHLNNASPSERLKKNQGLQIGNHPCK